MRLVLLGAPGAGKGTQAIALSRHFNIPHISTGEIFRGHMKNETEIGMKIKQSMNRGYLLPDDLAIHVVEVRLAEGDCKNGFLLDGFPRTIAQAKALESMNQEPDWVINVHVADEVIIERMAGRRVCPQCGASYHTIYKKPAKDHICDRCATTLVQRKDDQEETVRKRLRVYYEQTEPLTRFYQNKNRLLIVDGIGEVEEITAKIIQALGEKA